ncbi:MAG: four helix bundle protein [Candidatus Magasanikbacteria bacterium]
MKNKFYYNARASLLESRHWHSLMFERKQISKEEFTMLKTLAKEIEIRLNKLIKSQLARKSKD